MTYLNGDVLHIPVHCQGLTWFPRPVIEGDGRQVEPTLSCSATFTNSLERANTATLARTQQHKVSTNDKDILNVHGEIVATVSKKLVCPTVT